MKTDEILQQKPEIREEFPGTLGKLLGMSLIRNGTGQATVELEVDHQRHGNPAGTVHGACSAQSLTQRWLLHTGVLWLPAKASRRWNSRSTFCARFGKQSLAPGRRSFIPAGWWGFSSVTFAMNVDGWWHARQAHARRFAGCSPKDAKYQRNFSRDKKFVGENSVKSVKRYKGVGLCATKPGWIIAELTRASERSTQWTSDPTLGTTRE
jgi:hypothetical protein